MYYVKITLTYVVNTPINETTVFTGTSIKVMSGDEIKIYNLNVINIKRKLKL